VGSLKPAASWRLSLVSESHPGSRGQPSSVSLRQHVSAIQTAEPAVLRVRQPCSFERISLIPKANGSRLVHLPRRQTRSSLTHCHKSHQINLGNQAKVIHSLSAEREECLHTPYGG
jgi:hypothetical protein